MTPKRIPASEYHDPVFAEDSGASHDGTGYFVSLDDLVESCADAGLELPETVHGSEPMDIRFDAEDIVYRELEHRDIPCEVVDERVKPAAIKELQAYLDEWVKKHVPPMVEADCSTVIVLGEDERAYWRKCRGEEAAE